MYMVLHIAHGLCIKIASDFVRGNFLCTRAHKEFSSFATRAWRTSREKDLSPARLCIEQETSPRPEVWKEIKSMNKQMFIQQHTENQNSLNDNSRVIKIIRYPDVMLLQSMTKRHGKMAGDVMRGLTNMISTDHYQSDFFCAVMYNSDCEIIGHANFTRSRKPSGDKFIGVVHAISPNHRLRDYQAPCRFRQSANRGRRSPTSVRRDSISARSQDGDTSFWTA